MRFCPRCGSRYEHERFCPEDGAPTQPLPDAGPPRDALLGTLIDQRYRVDAQIGEGGMGVVYKAVHIALNKTVALKVLRGDMAKEPEVVQRFMQEAQAASGIGHENIVDIHDFGRLPDGTAYFVMEYLNGRALNELIQRGGSIPTGDALQILRQIASALGAAHERGIVHRDLKPDNVMVLYRSEIPNFVKVLDFGIAKVGATKNKLTRTGMVFGTPHYMSPEQAAGQSVDARTDIYALGVIMYEMFTGRVPFEADTFMGVLTKHMFEKPAPFGDQSERHLGALEQITLRALEKKPENRYASMQALIDDLDHVSGGGRPRTVAGARPSAELADALEPRSKSEMHLERQLAVDSTDTPPELPTAKRWPWIAGAVGVLVALVAALMSSSSEPPAPVAQEPAGATTSPATPDEQRAPASPEPPREQPSQEREPQRLTLRSEPPGAEILERGKVLGRTPGELARPTEGERSLELRLEGYQRATVALRPSSPANVDVALKELAPKKSRPARVAQTPAKKAAPAEIAEPAQPPPPTPPPPPAKPKRKRLTSEVVDPWAE